MYKPSHVTLCFVNLIYNMERWQQNFLENFVSFWKTIFLRFISIGERVINYFSLKRIRQFSHVMVSLTSIQRVNNAVWSFCSSISRSRAAFSKWPVDRFDTRHFSFVTLSSKTTFPKCKIAANVLYICTLFSREIPAFDSVPSITSNFIGFFEWLKPWQSDKYCK